MSRLFNFKKNLNESGELGLSTEDDFVFSYYGGDLSIKLNKKTLAMINRQCSEIINEYKQANGILLRGVVNLTSEISPNIYKKIPRTDRKPKDSNPESHEIIDKIFEKKFGWRPRTEGVFAITSPVNAAYYGSVCVFLPANGYKYIWSPKYKDLYSNFLNDIEMYLEEYQWENIYYEDLLTRNKYSTLGKIPDYVSFEYEKTTDEGQICIVYLRDKYGNKTWKRFIQKEPDMMKERLSRFDNAVNTYTDTNVKRAIHISHEVMFKCRYYYAIEIPGRGMSYNELDSAKIQDFGLGL